MDNQILEELRNEAIDAAEDRIANINLSLKGFADGRLRAEEAFSSVKLDAHSLKAVAGSFEMKALSVLCHRFEDFIFAEKKLTLEMVAPLQRFVDRLAECLDAWIHGRELDTAGLMRLLPAKGNFDVNSVTVSNIEIMLVMAPGTATKIVTRELVECGYRMVNVASTLDAFHLIPAMRPDLVIISRVMPELSGVDLVCALKAMPSTRSISLAMIASLDDSDIGQVQDLPAGVPILRKSSKFADDVARVFTELGIL